MKPVQIAQVSYFVYFVQLYPLRKIAAINTSYPLRKIAAINTSVVFGKTFSYASNMAKGNEHSAGHVNDMPMSQSDRQL